MRFPLILLLVLTAINLTVDFLIYNKLKHWKKLKWLKSVHVGFSAILYLVLSIITIFLSTAASESEFTSMMWGLFIVWSVYLSKYIYSLFALLAAIPKLFGRKAWKYCRYAGIGLGFTCFFTMWWGATITIRQIEVREVELHFKNLPQEFDGYRIVQFSDLHSGTYGESTGIVNRLVGRINSLNPDLVVFTGDIVNRKTSEIRPFISELKRIKAKNGVISVLGNHDYGDYFKWKSDEEKRQNLQELIDIQRDSLHWTLLCNEHVFLHRGGDSIAVIGVENWGEPPFSTYGNLSEAYPDTNDGRFKILLTHNPKHWDKVVSKTTNIDLSLSGHTHGMQVELSAGSSRLSPAAFRYDQWGGLYTRGDSRLYVNIGIGEVGVPMRIGATPELTVFTLKQEQQQWKSDK